MSFHIISLLVSLILLSPQYFHLNIFTALASQELYNADGTPRFSYNETTGRGPSNWSNLDPNWFLCRNGTRQSPINIRGAIIRPNLGPLFRNYTLANATLVNARFGIVVSYSNNSLSKLLVEWNGNAGNITINGTVFILKNAHWHTPSEHTILGIRYPLELQLVHESSTGNKAIIGILYRFGLLPNRFLSRLLPQINALGNVTLGNVTAEINLGRIDPNIISFGISRRYYRYNGSLTAPPCSENVTWTILPQVQSVLRAQVQALREAVDSGFEQNARPIQPLNGRTVALSIRI